MPDAGLPAKVFKLPEGKRRLLVFDHGAKVEKFTCPALVRRRDREHFSEMTAKQQLADDSLARNFIKKNLHLIKAAGFSHSKTVISIIDRNLFT